MSEVRIQAEPRTEFGKGAARRIRRADKVPVVLYGHGGEPRHLSMPGPELMLALKTPNVLLRIDGIGTSELALPKAVQRDPIKGFLEHVDLILVRSGEKVSVEVPIKVSGDVVVDGMLDLQLNSLTVLAEATHIPTEFEVDIQGLAIGDHITAADVKLPGGVELDVDAEALVLHIIPAPTAEELAEGEEEVEGAEAAEGKGAEAEGAEPAAEEPAESAG